MNRSISLVLLSLIVAAPVVAQDKVYRWQAEDGTIMFSDTPPADVDTENLELQQIPPTNTASPVSEQNMQQSADQAGERIDQRQQSRQAVQGELDATRTRLEQARSELEMGRQPQPGERQGKAGGGSRLSQSYFERIERQENEVKQLEQRTSELQQQLQSLR